MLGFRYLRLTIRAVISFRAQFLNQLLNQASQQRHFRPLALFTKSNSPLPHHHVEYAAHFSSFFVGLQNCQYKTLAVTVCFNSHIPDQE